MTTYSRREAKQLTQEVLGQYHALIMNNDLAGFEKLLAEFQPALSESTKRQLVEEFKLVCADAMRRRWRSSR